MGNNTSSRLSSSLIILFVAAIIYAQSDLLWKLVGRANIDKSRLVKWENSKALNNADCRVVEEMNACEDVKIHYPSNTAFLACGDPWERRSWYPCAGMRDAASRSKASFREFLFKYDILTGKSTQLQLRGLEGDFINHGIDVFSSPESPTTVSRASSCINTSTELIDHSCSSLLSITPEKEIRSSYSHTNWAQMSLIW